MGRLCCGLCLGFSILGGLGNGLLRNLPREVLRLFGEEGTNSRTCSPVIPRITMVFDIFDRMKIP